MDWDLKVTYWGFAGIETEDNCSSVDLNRQPMLSSAAAMAAAASSSSGSSKRPRPPSNSCQIASCLVDGCVSDLSKCREYHRRHKVCEAHSKTAIVMVGGREQRFCQQCSRFHLLVEFDEVKRSCRKRLDGHNRRRRKPQPDSLISGSFTNHQGHTFTSYGQVFPTTSTPKSSWPVLIKNEEDPPLYASRLPLHVADSHFPVSSRGSYREVKQFPFLQESVDGLSCLPPLKTASKVASSSSSSSKQFDSDCALSLLSSSAVHVSGVNLAASGDRIPVGQPLVPGMHHYAGLGQYSGSQASSYPTAISCSSMEEEQIGNMLVSDGGTDADFNCHGLFHVGLEGSPSRGNSQTLPFTWQ